jgi:ABC-type bacteriocin/lantibiotic exporter with double-glycine peptidase domain
MAMVAAMVLMGRISGLYRCAIQNGKKLETELIKIPMVHLPLGAMENRRFGGFARTTYCVCATRTIVAAMAMTIIVTLVVAAVMVMVKVGTMTMAAMPLVTVAMFVPSLPINETLMLIPFS